MAISEFEIIRRYFSDITFQPATHSGDNNSIALGIGDDCAVISIPEPYQLALSIDTQNAGIHFPANGNPEWIAQRAFRGAVSDLAAAGAKPLCFTLALTLPEANESWLQAFSTGLKKAAREFSCSLVGGDTTRGPLSITLQVHGLVEKNHFLTRRGAQPEDIVFVSGLLGASAAYVMLMQEQRLQDPALAHSVELFEQAYYFPTPTISLGRALVGCAHSAIDISDGLLADLGHICEASRVCARLDVDKIPMLPELAQTLGKQQALQLALTGGDDYQLCFTLPERRYRKLLSLCEDMECAITAIGHITGHVTSHGSEPANGESRIACYHADGSQVDTSAFTRTGYSHF